YFVNCIIDGNNTEEFQLDTASTTNSFNNAVFDHCTIKTQTNISWGGRFKSVLQNINPLFLDPSIYHFKLNSGSPAIGAGITLPNYPNDIDGNPRAVPPDIGAY
ncbi:MAG TPA: choice-of-anchor Q domain-containing protein, partial [Nitrosopumilaceae archaeon]|nr:choice-of-anchor Q domain-containing protein [Nitrosopumilaceae archaeon]